MKTWSLFLTTKGKNEMNKFLETNLVILNGYPVKLYHVLIASLGALAAWFIMVFAFAIF